MPWIRIQTVPWLQCWLTWLMQGRCINAVPGYRIVEVNARLSRSSALASKAQKQLIFEQSPAAPAMVRQPGIHLPTLLPSWPSAPCIKKVPRRLYS